MQARRLHDSRSGDRRYRLGYRMPGVRCGMNRVRDGSGDRRYRLGYRVTRARCGMNRVRDGSGDRRY